MKLLNDEWYNEAVLACFTSDGIFMKPKLKEIILQANLNEHNKEASLYDQIHTEIFNSFEQNRITKTLTRISSNLSRDTICLDLGAGTGNIATKLQKLGFHNIYCVDISSRMLQVLKHKTKLPEAQIICQNIDEFLEHTDLMPGLICLSSVLHHLPNYTETMKKINTIKQKKCVVYITHEPYFRNQRLIEKCLRRMDYFFYLIRYLLLIFMGRLKYLKRDCSISDYHTGSQAIQITQLEEILNCDYEIKYYSTARTALLAKLLSYRYPDNFEMILKHDSKKS